MTKAMVVWVKLFEMGAGIQAKLFGIKLHNHGSIVHFIRNDATDTASGSRGIPIPPGNEMNMAVEDGLPGGGPAIHTDVKTSDACIRSADLLPQKMYQVIGVSFFCRCHGKIIHNMPFGKDKVMPFAYRIPVLYGNDTLVFRNNQGFDIVVTETTVFHLVHSRCSTYDFTTMCATYHFADSLTCLLRRQWRNTQPIELALTRSTSIKDVIEAFGVPHTEIGSIHCNGKAVDFSHHVQDEQSFSLQGIPLPWTIHQATLLRPAYVGELRFLVDKNVGKLASYLRMAGFDTLYEPQWHEIDLLDKVLEQPRIVLTRNLDLLKRKQVTFGRCLRTGEPQKQLQEILSLFDIKHLPQVFSRCMQCNHLLEPVSKQDILPRLEPLTRRYFHVYKLCPQCDKIYWQGSHVDKMMQLLNRLHLE